MKAANSENLWSTIKVELVYRNTWASREEADTALFRYIDGWYNPRRIQKRLGAGCLQMSTRPPGTPDNTIYPTPSAATPS